MCCLSAETSDLFKSCVKTRDADVVFLSIARLLRKAAFWRRLIAFRSALAVYAAL